MKSCFFRKMKKQKHYSRDEERCAHQKNMKFPHQKSQSKIISALSHISPTHLKLFESPHIHESITVQIHSLSHTQSIIIARRENMHQRDEWPDAIRNSEGKNHRGIDPSDESAFDPYANYFLPPKNFHPQNLTRYMPCTSKICFAVRETLKEIENKKDDAENEKERNGMLTRRREES